MPQTWTACSPELAIELAAPPNWAYSAGDTIIGTIIRRSHIVTPTATVWVRLCGRAKTKIIVQHGRNRQSHRGRFNFFALNANQTHCSVFHGPVHVPEGTAHAQGWPFSITIPTVPMISPAESPPQSCSYLPLRLDHLARHSLPGTFHSKGRRYSRSFEYFVEYYLEAAIRYTRQGSPQVAVAVLPITLRHQPAASSPIIDFQLRRCSWANSIRGFRLYPSLQGASLSFRQKCLQLIGSSKVPKFRFTIQIIVPGLIQLENPNPVPIRLFAVTDDEQTTVATREDPPVLTLEYIKLIIRSETAGVAPSSWTLSPVEHHQAQGRDMRLEDAFAMLDNPVLIPYGSRDSSVDVGALLRLHLSATGLFAGGRCLARTPRIYPDFATYNIRHKNYLEWTVFWTVAGKRQKRSFSSQVTILESAD